MRLMRGKKGGEGQSLPPQLVTIRLTEKQAAQLHHWGVPSSAVLAKDIVKAFLSITEGADSQPERRKRAEAFAALMRHMQSMSTEDLVALAKLSAPSVEAENQLSLF